MMDEEQSRDKPRLTEARHAAKGLLKNAKVKAAPIAINQLMPTIKRAFDITIKGVPDSLFSGKGDAVIRRIDECVFLIYNDERPVVRKRFSVAHELGHLNFGHLHGNSSHDLGSENFDEIEANAFAAHLLMPPEHLRKDIKAGITDPEKLAEKYQVSTEALWLQLRNTGLFKIL
jgi:Zn-dependent peptidase ImmA (M78 family)